MSDWDDEPPDDPQDIEPLRRLTRDLRQATRTMTTTEVRYLVDNYYQMQKNRIRAAHQIRQQTETGEPHAVLTWFGENAETLETWTKSALAAYAESQRVGRWAQTIKGIGPVITAGLLAHIDITRAPTVGHIWRFAGLDPTVTWNKKQKRPWNGALKRLCWLMGESFVKVSGPSKKASRKCALYAELYVHRKKQEEERNAAGDFADQAAQALATKEWKRDTAAKAHYEAGRLPPGRLHLRAERWAVKIFLAHFHHAAYETHYGTPPPKPYVIAILGHGHEITIPNWPIE